MRTTPTLECSNNSGDFYIIGGGYHDEVQNFVLSTSTPHAARIQASAGYPNNGPEGDGCMAFVEDATTAKLAFTAEL